MLQDFGDEAMFQKDAAGWAKQTFGDCELGDKRRTKRLVDVGMRMANQVGNSLSKCCEGDEAALLGSYRLLRNEEMKPDTIREGGFAATVRQAQGHALLLAVEDTTSVSYAHAVAAQLGSISSTPNAKRRGYQVHSVLLLDAASEQTKESAHLCGYTVQVPQRGGRPARRARVSLRSVAVAVMPPAGSLAASSPLQLNAVLAEEIDAPLEVEPLRWVLLTTEPVASAREALTVIRYYECRWRIEDYHKAWKSGVGVERQRFQHPENLERMLAITAFLAVRLSQLRENQYSPADQEARTCDEVLSENEWKILWASTERCPLPPSIPSARWAYLALARLGGFTNTKRTGRPGWETLWHGWFRLQERVKGYQFSQ